uniref:sensor histidine kinase n=1 Tax=Methanosarcina horonobensis TaxID=418008 RepID=UPI000AFA5D61
MKFYKKIYRVNGKHVLYQSTLYDITERKETEKFLVNIETARKKEIHHRIKNNLQIISSLLDLQAEKFDNRKFIEDSEVKEAFRESQDRVISMALIHEELHKGGKIDTLNFSQYIEELANNLFFTYRPGNACITFDKDIEKDIFFDMDTAIPLGIIVNELFSNSLKYAFKGRNKGEIIIRLSGGGKTGGNIDSIEGRKKTKTVTAQFSFCLSQIMELVFQKILILRILIVSDFNWWFPL